MKCLCLLLLFVSFAICIVEDGPFWATLHQLLRDARKFKTSMFLPEYKGIHYIKFPKETRYWVEPDQLIGWFAAIPSTIPTNQVFNSNRTEVASKGENHYISTWLVNGEAHFNFTIIFENFYEVKGLNVYSNYSTFNLY